MSAVDDELIRMLSKELSRARDQLASIMVTESDIREDDGVSERAILLETKDMAPGMMLERYKSHMETFDTLPIDPSGSQLRFYRGEWSIWSGFPGNGKTTLLRQTCCHLLQSLAKDESLFIATLEQDPEWFLIEMAATAAGVDMPTERQLAAFLNTYGPRLKIWGMVGIAESKKILAMIRYLASSHGCRHAVVDSLMCLDIDSTKNEDQRQFANVLSATARARGVHIHLVAHPRKPMGPDQAPNTWDVAGSSDFGRLAFNVLFVRRGPEVEGSKDITSTIVHVLKQRTYGKIGEILGYFYSSQRQFHVDPYATEPTKYLAEDQYAPPGMNDFVPFVEPRKTFPELEDF